MEDRTMKMLRTYKRAMERELLASKEAEKYGQLTYAYQMYSEMRGRRLGVEEAIMSLGIFVRCDFIDGETVVKYCLSVDGDWKVYEEN